MGKAAPHLTKPCWFFKLDTFPVLLSLYLPFPCPFKFLLKIKKSLRFGGGEMLRKQVGEEMTAANKWRNEARSTLRPSRTKMFFAGLPMKTPDQATPPKTSRMLDGQIQQQTVVTVKWIFLQERYCYRSQFSFLWIQFLSIKCVGHSPVITTICEWMLSVFYIYFLSQLL